MDELFVILDITDCENWPGALEWHCGFNPPRRIPPEGRSNVVQISRDAAMQEAVRLANMHPGRTFALFSATHVTARVDVPRYVNLKGQPVQGDRVGQLLPIWDGIPF